MFRIPVAILHQLDAIPDSMGDLLQLCGANRALSAKPPRDLRRVHVGIVGGPNHASRSNQLPKLILQRYLCHASNSLAYPDFRSERLG